MKPSSAELWEDSRGQPWLVNALGYEVTWENRAARDRSQPIGLIDYQAARERLIQSRATHLDQLSDKLKEPRVHGVISRILSTEEADSEGLKVDDLHYVADLGLITLRPSVRISNRIYQEVLPRELTWPTQVMIANQDTLWYLNADHSLNMPKLLAAFQQFFREHSDSWSEGFDYKEAAPQLLMQAFLQRIINGGGRLNPGIRPRPQAHRSADRMAAGPGAGPVRAVATGRHRTQATARQARCGDPDRPGADPGLLPASRRRRGPSGHLQPPP